LLIANRTILGLDPWCVLIFWIRALNLTTVHKMLMY